MLRGGLAGGEGAGVPGQPPKICMLNRPVPGEQLENQSVFRPHFQQSALDVDMWRNMAIPHDADEVFIPVC